MIDLGRFQLGDWVPIAFSTTNSSGTPTAPSAAPVATFWDASSLGSSVTTQSIPVRDPSKLTAFFSYWMRLNSTFSVNKDYIIDVSATVGGTEFRTQLQFQTIPGGNTDGAVIGATAVHRPEAEQIVYQLDGGKLQARRNPY